MDYNMMKNFRDRENDQFCAAMMVDETDVTKELSDDFILPDYLPDVKRVVWVQACPRLGNRFLGSGILEYEGAVAYKVLYIAEDNRVRCAAFLSDFKNKIESEELGEDCVDVLMPVAKAVICRMQNPRKLNIRCKAGIEGAIWRRVSFVPELYGARSGEEKGIETKEECLDALNVTSRRESGLVYSEDITLESSMPAIGEVICSSADIYVDECRPAGNELLLRGVCEVELLYSFLMDEKEDYVLLRRTLPYSQSLEADTLKEGCNCRVKVLPEGVTVNVREDEFGKRRMIELDINYSLDMEVLHPKKLFYCRDCYSVDRECQSTSEQKQIWRMADSARPSFSVNENRLLSQIEASELIEVKACNVSPYLALEQERGKKDRPIFSGMAKVTVLGIKEDGMYCCTVFDVPLRLEGERSLAAQKVRILMDCRAAGVRCRSDGEKLYVDFEVISNMVLMACEEANSVQVIRMLPDKGREQEKGAVATLYFPDRGESMFDIAKKYRVSRVSLMERNGMEKEEQMDGRALLIPKKR
ncbi:MAG: DUF3794 domain-containing protein [Ruminococcaceae bacterium]|nr:DUF3794 domain-containing protein [Oscillospiraceae bacterium]